MKYRRFEQYALILSIAWSIVAGAALLFMTLSLGSSQRQSLLFAARLSAQREILFAREQLNRVADSKNILGFGIYDSDGKASFRQGSAPAVLPDTTTARPEIRESPQRRSVEVIEFFTLSVPDTPDILSLPGQSGGAAAVYIELRIDELFASLAHLEKTMLLSVIAIVASMALALALLIRADSTRIKLKAMEEEAGLADASRALGHELRNALAALRLRLEIIRRTGNASGEDLDAAQGEVQRMTILADRIGDFTRDPKGLPVIMPAIEAVTPVADRESIPVQDSSAGASIRIDVPRFDTALSNLVRNALEAGGPRDGVLMRIEASAQSVRISVLDRGTGLPASFQNALPSTFRTTKPSGMGIGLTIARRFMEAARGSIELQNRQDGGASATIILERVENEQ